MLHLQLVAIRQTFDVERHNRVFSDVTLFKQPGELEAVVEVYNGCFMLEDPPLLVAHPPCRPHSFADPCPPLPQLPVRQWGRKAFRAEPLL